MLKKLQRGSIINTERMNQENDLAIEIEELEQKIVPQSAATFID